MSDKKILNTRTLFIEKDTELTSSGILVINSSNWALKVWCYCYCLRKPMLKQYFLRHDFEKCWPYTEATTACFPSKLPYLKSRCKHGLCHSVVKLRLCKQDAMHEVLWPKLSVATGPRHVKSVVAIHGAAMF